MTTRRYTIAIIEALEEGTLTWERVARECLSFMSETDVEEMNRVAEFVSLEVEKGFYRCDDGSGESDIEADSAREAAEEYARECDYEVDGKTILVTVNVEGFDGESERIVVALDPEEPACEEGYSHYWQKDSNQGNGGGVIATDVCRWCGVQRTTDTWATNPDDGSQGHRTISYSAARDDFMPRALGYYPFLRGTRIDDGERFRLDYEVYRVEGDEGQVCGWSAVRERDGKKFPLASLGTYETWQEVRFLGPEGADNEG